MGTPAAASTREYDDPSGRNHAANQPQQRLNTTTHSAISSISSYAYRLTVSSRVHVLVTGGGEATAARGQPEIRHLELRRRVALR